MAVFEKGDKVKLFLPDEEKKRGLLSEFDQKEFLVSKVSHAGGGYCELEGAVSEFGVPFSFLPSWLVKEA